MFSGIISHIAEVVYYEDSVLKIKASGFSEIVLGESIAVNGVCLTVAANDQQLSFDISQQTLAVTNLSQLKVGDKVNLERALTVSSVLGGHLVSGHVDTTMQLISSNSLGKDWILELCYQVEHKPFLVPKGSIAVNGVSLTIQDVGSDSITLVLIPETCRATNLTACPIGSILNIEFDLITKTVWHQIQIMKSS